MGYALGVMAPPNMPIRTFVDYVMQAERHGFDEVWFAEDCFLKGGISQAAVALASTSRIVVGVGILPAGARNVVFAALEIAFLANLYPGRLMVGIGHGMADWMRQVGAHPSSPLTLLQEYLQSLRALLAGETVTFSGRHIQLSKVRLDEPPATAPLVLAGVRGPKSLALSGEHADGTILAEPVTPEYLDFARRKIGVGEGHPIVAYNVAAVDDDGDAARSQVRPALAVVGQPAWAPHIKPLDFADELTALSRSGPSPAEFSRNLPDDWVDRLAVVGSPSQARTRLQQLHLAGAEHLVLTPTGADPVAVLENLSRVR
jgi:alkanesulfonate monooxygenase SsuD/methylene tetrahydromethanopterin reductase-like flavin-dependent oxidoreductase (luciferase family)